MEDITMTTTTTPEVTGKAHPACELLPRMAEKEFRELQRDIGRYGLRHPIIVDEEGTILDGRHRYQAVVRLPGTDLKVEVFRGTEAEKAALVMSENIHRRHLTTDQRAAIAADLATLGRGGDRGNQYTGGKVSNDPLATSEEPATTIAQAAEVMNVSVPSVKRARAIKAKDPAAHEAAKRGDKPKSSKRPRRERLQHPRPRPSRSASTTCS
jgi:ParB-like nuclease domain